MKILIVEDSKFLRLTIERTLLNNGFSVVSAANGEEALRAALDSSPDLILLDMMLPGITGPDVLYRLKSNSATSRAPVIVLSGLSQKNEAKLLAAGAAAYFQKTEKGFEKGMGSLVALIQRVITVTGLDARIS